MNHPYRQGEPSAPKHPAWTVTLKNGNTETVYADIGIVSDADNLVFHFKKPHTSPFESDRRTVAAYADGEWRSFRLEQDGAR